MEYLSEALGLLVIGMIMVIIVLWLVVGLGNLLIHLTNRFIPDEIKQIDTNRSEKQIHSKQMAAIIAAVEIITNGQGKVDSIQMR